MCDLSFYHPNSRTFMGGSGTLLISLVDVDNTVLDEASQQVQVARVSCQVSGESQI